MFHVVTADNRHLYRSQMREMFRIRALHDEDEPDWTELWTCSGGGPDGGDDERAVYLMALGVSEELQAFARIRPTHDHSGTWEVGHGWFDARTGDAHVGAHRLLTGAVEFIQARGGERLIVVIDVRNFPRITDGALAFKITGPPASYRHGVLASLTHEVSEDQLVRMRDSLGEPPPLTYVVDDEDVALRGSLAQVQREVDSARRIDLAAAKIDMARPAKTKAWIKGCFAFLDAALSGAGWAAAD